VTAAERSDVIVVGAGHNALVTAAILARSGLSVTVVEAEDVIGGACRTEQPFEKAPELSQSTGAYLLGLMPPEIPRLLDLDLPLMRRDPHYFVPTTGSAYLLFGSDHDAMRRQFVTHFSEADWRADQALAAEINAIRTDLAPAWLAEPLSLEDTAERYLRPELREAFLGLVRDPIIDYLQRFGFASDLVVAMYAVTDGLTGFNGGIDTPGSGANFLAHNMCRLPDSDGTWMIVRGGMGTVTSAIADVATKAGARISTRSPVARIRIDGGTARGVILRDGTELSADIVVVGADPFRLRAMVGDVNLPTSLTTRMDEWLRDGSTLKVNLALTDVPIFRCLPEDRGQHSATIHLLPDHDDPLGALRRMTADVEAGRLPDEPTIEWYVHTTRDPSLRDARGHHSSALFVQSVPYRPAESTWPDEMDRYVEHLLGICDRFAPGTSSLVADTFPLAPPDIEAHFGITRGHIHHVDNGFAFDQRMPYAVPGVEGLYAASAGCHPAGSVIGAAGHNAAQRILADLGGAPYTGE
jgi:phytoene dehydrogenase-like protein